MRALVQRVREASVTVDGSVVGAIGPGLLVLLGVARDDTAAQAIAAAGKVHGLRVLRDERSLADTPDAAALVVSQFTLYGDTRKGRRPSWSAAAGSAVAEPLVTAFGAELARLGTTVETGVFGTDMQVALINDGPVTVLIDVDPPH